MHPEWSVCPIQSSSLPSFNPVALRLLFVLQRLVGAPDAGVSAGVELAACPGSLVKAALAAELRLALRCVADGAAPQAAEGAQEHAFAGCAIGGAGSLGVNAACCCLFPALFEAAQLLRDALSTVMISEAARRRMPSVHWRRCFPVRPAWLPPGFPFMPERERERERDRLCVSLPPT